jgi:hypothetical protein
MNNNINSFDCQVRSGDNNQHIVVITPNDNTNLVSEMVSAINNVNQSNLISGQVPFMALNSSYFDSPDLDSREIYFDIGIVSVINDAPTNIENCGNNYGNYNNLNCTWKSQKKYTL